MVQTNERPLRVILGFPAEFTQDFLKATTSHAIIGLDFLEHLQILLNPHERLMTLPQRSEGTSIPSIPSTVLVEHEAISEQQQPITTAQTAFSSETLFSQYLSVF